MVDKQINNEILNNLENISLLRRESNVKLRFFGMQYVMYLILALCSNRVFELVPMFIIYSATQYFSDVKKRNPFFSLISVCLYGSIPSLLIFGLVNEFINDQILYVFNYKNDFLVEIFNQQPVDLTLNELSRGFAFLILGLFFQIYIYFTVNKKREILFLYESNGSLKNLKSQIEENVIQSKRGNNSKDKLLNTNSQSLSKNNFAKNKITSNIDQLLKIGHNSYERARNTIKSRTNNEMIPEESICDLESAVDNFSSVIDLDPTKIEALEFRGYSYMFLQKFNNAILDFTKLIESEGQNCNLSIFESRALAFFKLNRYQECITDCSRIVESGNDFENALLTRADAFKNVENYPLAIKDYSYAIEINPENIEPFFSRGELFLKIKKYRKAYIDLKKCAEFIKENEWLYQSLIEAAFNLEYFAAVKKYCNKLISINEQSDWAFCMRALSFLKEEKYDAAINDFTRAIELNTQNDKAYEGRGSVYYILKRLTEASSDFRQAISINPDNEDCIKLLEKINVDLNS